MAAEVSALPNGNYGLHQSYGGGADQNSFGYPTNNQNSQPLSSQAPPSSSTPAGAQPTPQPDIPKDEVGWYFVEQYYTTLSRTPEKLYLFYNKRSQFVSGQETDKVAVCVGQRAINDKIRDLDFNDCKVRVTNVDSQASDSNIVIQVIGELSNRGQPHKKFTQTFVLATQTNGYFVLNDIFRYLVEEEEETEPEASQLQEEVQQVSGTESGVQEPPPSAAAPDTLASSSDPAVVEHDAEEVDKKIEEKLVNGTKPEAEEKPAPVEEEKPAAVEEKPAEEAPAAQPAAEVTPQKELEKPVAAEAEVVEEAPKTPEPTRAATPPKQEAQRPAAAPKPAAPALPKTWASLAASAAKTVAPVVPQPVAQAAKTVQQKAAAAIPSAPVAAVVNAVTPNTPSAPSSQDAKGNDSQDEWTAVGSSHNRNASKQTNAAPQQQEPQFRGYIKNVADNVEAGKLRAELEKFGEVIYFDIARQKNCAFVDFKTAEAHNKAKATQFEVEGNDVPLFVEERKFRPGSTPYVPRGQYQGGRGGARGGANQGAPRGNFQNGRGAPGQGAPRGRGGYAAAGQRGGRGGAQA